MAQNIYDNPEFFAGYAQLPRSMHGLDGAPEWAALRSLLPPLEGLDVVDLGCGYGWFSRYAAEQGARTVSGLDVSQKMLDHARANTDAAQVSYFHADLDQLELPTAAFDLAYSSLTLHYLADLAHFMRNVHDALRPGGSLVFSIEHPIYMASVKPGWVVDGDGRRCWPVDHYQDEGERRTDWLAKGVLKHHRTLGSILNAVIGAGLTLRHVEDWGPSAGQVQANPALAEERERPMLLLVAAQR
ncbi:class I SAM-dependent methyltransferase [Pseudomonas sp. GD04087]|uniref:class I SAM-dependent methyltransferase n=1 Tax=Pseudomonas TaxID=286 RepID=UPI001F2826D3|nr:MULTISPECIES: class I SAM-dependent methyltransferase [Pseudomonas]MDH0293254.1 class I SAM-dependent methyltransferase [Pseudomonas sp. GD04087]MDH1047441.1 class I SAM-dependent methyltransferase [Pseudomonas sp. GD03903]MDH2000252.1 class I SAM-dependent methyltransferase [Pseudomonas sp. GD03691]